MPDISHDFPIRAAPSAVFRAVTAPEGLDQWWTKTSSGSPEEGTEYALGFGPDHQWRARVTKSERDRAFELEMVECHADWKGTRVGFMLEGRGDVTEVRFHHRGWPESNGHYRGSCYCWAMYLRILKRHVESGEIVPYERRLDV